MGEYWDRQAQIDVVGLREDDWTDIGECKWGAVTSPRAVVDELRDRARRYPNERNATIARRLFTRRPSDPDLARELGVRWHDLDDLYAA